MAAAAWKEATKWIAEPMLTCGCAGDAEGVGEDRDAAELGEPAGAADVGLDDVEPADPQVAQHLVAVGDHVVGDRDRQRAGDLGVALDLLVRQRGLEEADAERLELAADPDGGGHVVVAGGVGVDLDTASEVGAHRLAPRRRRPRRRGRSPS
jgi:hypothetical protein